MGKQTAIIWQQNIHEAKCGFMPNTTIVLFWGIFFITQKTILSKSLLTNFDEDKLEHISERQ
jgi:hypothetical protein